MFKLGACLRLIKNIASTTAMTTMKIIRISQPIVWSDVDCSLPICVINRFVGLLVLLKLMFMSIGI